MFKLRFKGEFRELPRAIGLMRWEHGTGGTQFIVPVFNSEDDRA